MDWFRCILFWGHCLVKVGYLVPRQIKGKKNTMPLYVSSSITSRRLVLCVYTSTKSGKMHFRNNFDVDCFTPLSS